MNDNNILDNRGFYDGLTPLQTQTLFDNTETTIAHLFRFSHPALLWGVPYGAAFCYALLKRNLINDQTTSIVEVGGGLGHLAASFLSYLSLQSNIKSDLTYTIIDISPSLQRCQQKRLSRFINTNFLLANAESLPFQDDELSYTTIISNEVIADLTSIQLTSVEFIDSINPVVILLRNSYQAINGCLPQIIDNIIINTGAIQFITEINRVLKCGSVVITEHGDGKARLIECGSLGNNAQETHFEVSIDFDHLVLVAQYLGFETEILHLIDFLPISKSMRVANYNDAKALQGDKSENWQIEAIPLQKVYEVYTNKIGSIEAQKLVQGFLDGGLQFPQIGGDKFPDNNTLPFRQAFKVLILRKS